MTPDGILTEDWDQVAALGAEIANSACRDDEHSASERRAQLLRLLERLEDKYGERASILATRADHVKHAPTRLRLLKRALEVAKQGRDLVNQTLVASSLAEIYIEELRNPKEGEYWVKVLEAYVLQSGDDSGTAGLAYLKEELDRLTTSAVRRK